MCVCLYAARFDMRMLALALLRAGEQYNPPTPLRVACTASLWRGAHPNTLAALDIVAAAAGVAATARVSHDAKGDAELAARVLQALLRERSRLVRVYEQLAQAYAYLCVTRSDESSETAE